VRVYTGILAIAEVICAIGFFTASVEAVKFVDVGVVRPSHDLREKEISPSTNPPLENRRTQTAGEEA